MRKFWNSSEASAADFVLLFFWAGLLAWLMSRHIPWRDEYQAWLVAIRTNSWSDFFETVRLERAPPLHYLLLKGAFALSRFFAYLGWESDPERILYFRAVSFPFSVGSIALILLGSGLPRWCRYLLPFSIFFLLDYGVISRNYPIGAFFVLLSAFLYLKKRREWAWLSLGLASCVHLFYLAFAGFLLLIELWEERQVTFRRDFWQPRRIAAMVTAIALMGISFWTQLPPQNSAFAKGLNTAISFHQVEYNLTHFLPYGLTGMGHMAGKFRWSKNGFDQFGDLRDWRMVAILALPFSTVFFGFPLHYLFLLSAAPLAILSSGTYPTASRYAGFIFIAWIVCLMLRRRRLHPFVLSVSAVFFLISAATGISWIATWKPYLARPAFDFSGTGELDEALGSELRNPHIAILTDSEELMFPITALARRPIFDIVRNSPMSHPYCVYLPHAMDLKEWCGIYGEAFLKAHSGEKILLLRKAELGDPPPECGKFDLVFRNHRPLMVEESYSVFEWKPKS